MKRKDGEKADWIRSSRFLIFSWFSACSSRFSAGDVHYYPGLHVVHNPMEAERLARDLERYLTRKIGFESVMRIRCTKGWSCRLTINLQRTS